MHRDDHIVADAEYARWRVFRLDQIAHDLVVEERDLGPLDALLLVLFLQWRDKQRLTNNSF